MMTNLALEEPKGRSLIARIRTLLIGEPLPEHSSARVHATIQRAQEESEVLVSVIQLLAIATFAVLYTLTPKGFGADVSFEPVPLTLAVYSAFTIVRLWLAIKRLSLIHI